MVNLPLAYEIIPSFFQQNSRMRVAIMIQSSRVRTVKSDGFTKTVYERFPIFAIFGITPHVLETQPVDLIIPMGTLNVFFEILQNIESRFL
ncbi:MAG: hypothetical protein ABIH23_24450, partial [bacterium]